MHTCEVMCETQIVNTYHKYISDSQSSTLEHLPSIDGEGSSLFLHYTEIRDSLAEQIDR